METSAIKRLKEIILNNQEEDKSYYLYEDTIQQIGCCDSLKNKDSQHNYWNVTMLLPKTDYTLWWLDQWITIFPEMEKRIIIDDMIKLIPNEDDYYQKHHFIWTLLRMSYNNNLGYKTYKCKNENFLGTLRFFLYIGQTNKGRFITESTYFNTNIEKARKIFNGGNFRHMWNVFSGSIQCSNNLSFLKGVHNLENRINKVNEYFSVLDEITNKDKVGSVYYTYKNNKSYLSYYSKDNIIIRNKLGGSSTILPEEYSLLIPTNNYDF